MIGAHSTILLLSTPPSYCWISEPCHRYIIPVESAFGFKQQNSQPWKNTEKAVPQPENCQLIPVVNKQELHGG